MCRFVVCSPPLERPWRPRVSEGATESGRRAAGAGGDPERLPPAERHRRLVELIEQRGFAIVSELARRFAVSEMTIRRDLEGLRRIGRLVRTHGGALEPAVRAAELVFPTEPAFEERRSRNAAAKARIARRAAALVGPDETVALDVGTSVLALAQELATRRDLRLLTNSVPAALALVSGRATVYLLGGQLRGPELSVIGPAALTQAGGYYVDKLFLGAAGITEDGLHDYSIEDTAVKQALIARAASVIVLCDASKLGRRALARICTLRTCRAIVTDRPPPPDLLAAIEAEGVELVIAD
jgi:DeoR family glycerol-3-phosphate regulon repressor